MLTQFRDGFADDQAAGDGDDFRQRGARLLNQVNELARGLAADPGDVLLHGGELRLAHLNHGHAVVSGDGNILRNPQTRRANGVHAAQRGVVIRHQDAGRRLRQLKQLTRQLRAAVGVMVHALADVLLRDLQSQRVAGAIESRQAVFRDGMRSSMNATGCRSM